MSKPLSSAAILIGFSLLSSTAMADPSDNYEITIKGEAKPVCALPAQPEASGNNSKFAENIVTIEKLIDDTTATAKASTLTLKFPKVMCNYAATVTLASLQGGMVVEGVKTDLTGGMFLKRVDYRVTGSWGTLALTPLNTTGVEGATATTAINGANSADLTLTVLTQNGNAPVIAGDFTDILVLKVGASF